MLASSVSAVGPPRCPVARGVMDALRDGEADYEARGVLVVTDVEPDSGLQTADHVAYRAVYTVFRALPTRLAEGGTLRVSSHARAGGDVELSWESIEDPSATQHAAGLNPREALAHGPMGDLLEVALLALEHVCRARGGLVERTVPPPESSAFLRTPTLQRRYLFLIPGTDRASYAPTGPKNEP